MKRKLLSLFLTLTLLLSLTATALAAPHDAESSFSDVKKSDYYYDAVLWAVAQGVTVGTSKTTFSPDDACTRAQIVTFLWRAAGSPAPTRKSCLFTDVDVDAYYYEALLWALDEGITEGTSATTFSPEAGCTRAQVVTFLYRFAGSPKNPVDRCEFKDVDSVAFYYDALLWALENEVTEGTSATTFSPNATCTRAQIVTFLYRAIGGENTEPDPTEPTEAPTEPTEAPTEPTEAPTEPTEAPTEPTEAPTEPTEAPTEPTEAPTEPTEAPTEPTEAPTEPTEAPTEPTEALTEPTEAPMEPTEGYAVQLTAPQRADIWVYNTQTVTGTADVVIASGETGTVYARDTQGSIDVSGSGQVNFVVVPDEGFEVDTVTATGSYKNLKGPDETGTDNAYRVTKVTAGDVVITVTLKETSDDPGTVTTGPTCFVFSDDGITVSGNTANKYSINGTALSISGEGTYIVSGSCKDGSITVKKATTDVTLILNGLTLTSSDTAPITCNKSTEVIIEAAAGTVNTLTDSAYNNDDNYPDNANAENAVIKCKDGSIVTLCGTGTVNVISNGKNGVKGGLTTETEGTARLTVKELTLNITANANDALKSDQELNILSGNITINATDDAIKSDYVLNIGAEGTEGPTINVVKSYEGIEAATLSVYSGNITVHASDDGMNAANADLTGYSFALNIYGGTLYVDAQGDGLDSNGTLTLAGGTVEVYSSSRNDNAPLDSDGTLTLSGGTVLAVGTGGMAQTPNNAKQRYVSFGAGGMGGPGGPGGPGGGGGWHPGQPGSGSNISIAAGDSITVRDASGNVLYSATAVRAASYVFFSSAALVSGQTYTLLVNGTAVATANA